MSKRVNGERGNRAKRGAMPSGHASKVRGNCAHNKYSAPVGVDPVPFVAGDVFWRVAASMGIKRADHE